MALLTGTHTVTQQLSGSTTPYILARIDEWIELPVASIHIARRTVGPPFTRMRVPVNMPATGLFQLESILLGANFTVLHVAPGVTSPNETHAFLATSSNF